MPHDVYELAFDQRVLDVPWVPNGALCCLCYEPFTMLAKRRHHCRLCGLVVCGACSPHKTVLQTGGRHAARTCLDCAAVLTNLAAHGDPRVKRRRATAFQTKTRAAPVLLPTRATRELPAAELRRVLLANAKSLEAAATYFVVHALWYDAWLAFVKATAAARANAPGPISNHALLHFYNGQLHAKEHVQYKSEYRLVHEDAWRTLHSIYGGGPIISLRWDGEGAPSTANWRISFPALTTKEAPMKPVSLGRLRNSGSSVTLGQRPTIEKVYSVDRTTLSAVDEVLLPSPQPQPSLSPAQERQLAAKAAVEAFAKAAGQARREAEGITYRKSLVSLADVDMRLSLTFCAAT
ncbi:hypothetical protein ACHHYP_16691 [Achlya hypogyna]|uniref:FYVE-type domain-containing protein n=1 Tax=Achlya hypogyna TaxID=1202772 RepID=A0A1V9Y659_ACHHY|nr:hypothetical protein ACHHYP_16691 [Achlya hypogyna]